MKKTFCLVVLALSLSHAQAFNALMQTYLKNGGQNVNTNKPITALAPSANPARLTDVAEVEKWLRRNFNDVFAREGMALEKDDGKLERSLWHGCLFGQS